MRSDEDRARFGHATMRRDVELVSAETLVGTCSWADPTLLKAGFYPRGVNTAKARMQYYSSLFRIVEVDSSYYAMPSDSVSGKWATWSPSGFVFDVKAFRLFTHHPTPIAALPPDIRASLPSTVAAKSNLYLRDVPPEAASELWSRFESALLPLDSAGKLGVVLFQFPPWFLPGRDSRDYLLYLRERLPQYTPAIEFRASSWLDAEHRSDIIAFLRDSALAFVCVDEPQGFRSSVPPITEVTADAALVRFHGRNKAAWEKSGNSAADRFNYLYSEDELKEWLPRVHELAAKARQLHVLFNNCYGDKAVGNAKQMASMLDSLAATAGGTRPAQE